MIYHTRLIEPFLLQLFEHFPIVAVLGARQVGKSTLVNELFRERMKTVVFDPVEDIGQARQDPDFFLQNNPPPLFLDEVQYAPELLSALKRRVDLRPEKGQYVISGSQNLTVVKNISESLAGRVAIVELLPMSFREFTHVVDRPSLLEDWVASRGQSVDSAVSASPQPWFPVIWRGGYPGLLELPDSLVQNQRQSYMQTYVERDIRSVAGVGDLQLFGRFFALLSAYSARQVNPAELGRELGVDRKTAIAWKSIATATYQWFEIPAFTRNATKRVAGKHKGYMADTGHICYHQRITSPDAIAGHPLQGQLVETWTAMEILKTVQPWPTRPNFYHYRSHGGAEVDLILELDGWLFPIEIKSKAHPSHTDVRGIHSFRKNFPQERITNGLIICAVEQPEWIAKDILAVPWWIL